MTDYAQPFLKWAGSKFQLLPTLMPIMDRAIAACADPIYVEPFVGGGSVALNVDPGATKVLCDMCLPLVLTWGAVQHHPDALAAVTARIGLTEADYYRTRDTLNVRMTNRHSAPVQVAAGFMHVNRQGYNGLWRVNAQGLCNVPWGKRMATPHDAERLRAASARIPIPRAYDAIGSLSIPRGAGATIFQRSATDVLGGLIDAARPIVAFCDPPYDNVFGSYTKDGFDGDDQRELADVLHRLADRGHAIVATNADTPLVRDIYAWADVVPIAERRRISSDGNRDAAACLLITRNCA